VGFFVLIGLVCLAHLAINLGKIEIYGEGYPILCQLRQCLRASRPGPPWK